MGEDIETSGSACLPRGIPRAIVALPIRNERDRIAACLESFACQVGIAPGDFGIVLFLNNCSDDTAQAVQTVEMPWPMRVIVRNDPAATAGWARRCAMDIAAAWLAEAPDADGVLLTSDADSRVAPNWVASNLAAIAHGADLVAGRITLDAGEAAFLPERLHARGRLEARYEALLTEIDARLDPEPGNPWPCHWTRSGATLAVRHSVYRRVGGMPDMACGEDRAFVDAVRAHGWVVRHDCEIEVVTSGRLDGRAAGGVADTIKLRCDVPDSPCDDRLERLDRLLVRVFWRRRLRQLFATRLLHAVWRWAPALSIPTLLARQLATYDCFGKAHAAIEAASPRLAYQPLQPKHLPSQIRRAALVVSILRTIDRRRSYRLRRPEFDPRLQVECPHYPESTEAAKGDELCIGLPSSTGTIARLHLQLMPLDGP